MTVGSGGTNWAAVPVLRPCFRTRGGCFPATVTSGTCLSVKVSKAPLSKSTLFQRNVIYTLYDTLTTVSKCLFKLLTVRDNSTTNQEKQSSVRLFSSEGNRKKKKTKQNLFEKGR